MNGFLQRSAWACRLAAWCGLLLAPAGHALPLLQFAGTGPGPAASSVSLLAAGSAPPAPWHVAGLPQQAKPVTQYQLLALDGRPTLRVEANASYGNLVHPLPPAGPAASLSWRWRVDQPLAQADLRQRSGDDAAVKVCALFDMEDHAVPFLERQLLRVARLRTHEGLPAATVCYVWDTHFPTGTVIENAFTRRMRMIVVRGEGAATHTWTQERRDLRADFLQLFGSESPQVPRLMAVAVAADADNTHGHSLAYVSDLNLE